MSKSKKAFAKILDYLETYDAEMRELISDAAVEYAFNLKGRVGVTFVNPVDTAWRNQVKELLATEDIEKMQMAGDMIAAHVLIDALKTPSDFKNKADDIPNALGQHVEIDAAKSTGETVVLKNGARAKVDDRFRDASKRGKLVVYTLTHGSIGTENPPAKLKYVKRSRKRADEKEKEEKPEPVVPREHSTRYQIMIEVENTYINDSIERAKAGRKQTMPRDIYLETVMSLVNYILIMQDRVIYDDVLKSKILPLISFTHIDFYLIFEPYRTTGPYLVDEWIIRDWYEHRPPFDLSEVTSAINGMLEEGAKNKMAARAPRVLSDREKLLDEIDNQRALISRIEQGRRLPERVTKIYMDLVKNNAIGGLDNVFPAGLIQLYRNDPHRKIIEDELRYITYQLFDNLEVGSTFDINKYEYIIEMIANCLSTLPESGLLDASKLYLLNVERMKWLISPVEYVSELKQLIDSSFFLYVPLSAAEADDFPHEFTLVKPDPSDDRIFHPIGAVYQQLARRLKGSSTIVGESNETILRVLRQLNMNAAKMPPRVKEALDHLIRKRQEHLAAQEETTREDSKGTK